MASKTTEVEKETQIVIGKWEEEHADIASLMEGHGYEMSHVMDNGNLAFFERKWEFEVDLGADVQETTLVPPYTSHDQYVADSELSKKYGISICGNNYFERRIERKHAINVTQVIRFELNRKIHQNKHVIGCAYRARLLKIPHEKVGKLQPEKEEGMEELDLPTIDEFVCGCVSDFDDLTVATRDLVPQLISDMRAEIDAWKAEHEHAVASFAALQYLHGALRQFDGIRRLHE